VKHYQFGLDSIEFSNIKAILFDFDGPLCDVFARISADSIARELQTMIGRQHDSDDPLDVLESLGQGDRSTLVKVEDELTSWEVRAVNNSLTTPGGLECVCACAEFGLLTGIVSNNSASSVSTFVEKQGLASFVQTIVGRAYAAPEKMKPNPWPLQLALKNLEISAGEAVMVGDSLSDIQAALATGVPVIGYANKPGKRELFQPFNVPIIETMWELHRVIRILD